jgi:deoxyribonuclease-4
MRYSLEMRLLGVHVSIAGGLSRAIERGTDLGCTALQIFVANPNRWRLDTLPEGEAVRFRRRWRSSEIGPVVAHAAYLINLCAIDERVLERSRGRLGAELERSTALGLDALVVHPGAHMGRGEEPAAELVAASLDAVLGDREPAATRVLLELTAGQGTVVGSRLEALERIMERTRCGARLGLCLDTCHLFAAGYALDTEAGIEELLAEVEARFGPGRLGCVHLNDSRHPRGSRRDRHANIGAGEIGTRPLAYLAHHPAVADVPLILETPRGDDGDGHRRDLAKLRRALR